MYRVEYNPPDAGQSWTGHGIYGSEAAAIQNAERIAPHRYAVRVVDDRGNTVWGAGSGRG